MNHGQAVTHNLRSGSSTQLTSLARTTHATDLLLRRCFVLLPLWQMTSAGYGDIVPVSGAEYAIAIMAMVSKEAYLFRHAVLRESQHVRSHDTQTQQVQVGRLGIHAVMFIFSHSSSVLISKPAIQGKPLSETASLLRLLCFYSACIQTSQWGCFDPAPPGCVRVFLKPSLHLP